MTNNSTDQSPESPPPDVAADELDEPGDGAEFPVVGVGASAGGLEAFTQLLKALPVDTGMAFVLVQHLAPSHASALAEILSRATKMPVLEVQDEPAVEPNHVYVIPPARSMVIAGGKLQLLPREDRKAPHPVDQFFRSLADDRRHRAVGVVLSGTATDGTLGLEAIKAEGGITFAQDSSALHEGMPHSAIAAGCVDFVLPPDGIARELARIGQHLSAESETERRETHDKPDLTQVVQLLHHATGVDFSNYKFNTLYRRVTRRMVFQKLESLTDYVQFLRQMPGEVQALYQDILISVTSFFRDKEAFEALKTKVFLRLLKDRSHQGPVRVWTLGCSTGQEVYSLAMAFVEAAEAAGSTVPVQLFATDLNPAGVEKARAGVYPKDIAQDVSPERLRRFFTEVDGHYRIAKSIRDACVFSRHNVLTDPPFSRIDMISCRNLLIYLEPVLQQKLVPTLHYALKSPGFLWLGGSETIGSYRNLFDAEDAKHKIYVKKPGSVGLGQFPLQHGGMPRAPFIPITARPGDAAADLPREADRILSAKFAPPGVLVTADLDILQYRGDTGAYLAPAPGKASLNLLKMLREGLLVAVRAAVLRAGETETAVREEGLRVKSNGGYHEVAIVVIPVKGSGTAKGGFLILFEEAGAAAGRSQPPAAAPNERRPDAATSAADPDSSRLAQELSATREYLQSVIEQQEAANEELQSANEEVQSANEELQSTNEELETSKEEIQSSNEELATVNDELNNRNAELSRASSDLVNLFDSVNMAIVMLGPDFRVRRFTPAAEKLLNLIPADLGRPLPDLKLSLADLSDLDALLTEVLDTVSVRERDVQDKQGRWYSLRLRPYRTVDNKIDSVVLVLVDVDAMKRAHAFTESIVATVREPLLVLDKDLRVKTASRAFYENFRAAPEDTENKLLYELGNGQWDIPDLRRLLEEVLPRKTEVNDFEIEHEFEHVGTRTMRLNARRLVQAAEQSPLILLAIEDVTAQKQTLERLRESEERFRNLADNMSQLAWTCDQLGNVTWYNQRWLDYTGLAFEDMKGWDWKKVQHPDHVDRVVERVQRSADTGEPWEDTFPLRGNDGSYRWFLSRAVPIRDDKGKVVRWFGTNTDVTAQRQMEAELRQFTADLSEADRRKNEFLAMLAHELRNPLAPIRNAAQVLRFSEGNGEAVRSASAMLERQVGQMVRLVDDLLDVSRISRGKIELRMVRTELPSVIHHAVEAARPLAQHMGQDLSVTVAPEPMYVNGDPARLSQIVGNLLTNAFKFSGKDGRVSLSAEREGEEAVVRVRDTGIGIAADQLARIFDMFVQVDTSVERSVSGLGIGLTLVKSLVELHGGSIEAESPCIGKGSTFTVRLPLASDDAKRPEPTVADTAALATPARRILVVDDNVDGAESLAMMLDLSGHTTRTAHTGPEAIDSARAFSPEVVFLDIGLPGMNGYEVAKRFRADLSLNGVVLVALTGWGSEDDRQRSHEAGFDFHLTKPVEATAVEELLARFSPLGHGHGEAPEAANG